MNITAKCGCGASIDLNSRQNAHWGGSDSFADARVMEVFDKWNASHQGCSSTMAEAQRPPPRLLTAAGEAALWEEQARAGRIVPVPEQS